jgi:hypothetical protein
VFAVVGETRAAEIRNASGSVVLKALIKGATLSKFEFAKDLPLALGLVWVINFAHLQRLGAMGAAAAV